jgi:dihydrofolate synthase/folylpolyglutamate synthase
MVKMPHWPVPREKSLIKLGLERIEKFLEYLGNPQEKMPPVIHVAGTNGKGSTVAFIRSILQAAGLKVHVYTSPHLVQFNERIVIADQQIEDNYLHQLLEECRIVADKHNLEVSFFEGTTAAAFLAFSRVKADIVLLEVGLGGRLDATNIIKNPILTIITPISLDHVDMLGDTISKIAYEKACIMKPNVPCVVSLQEEEADNVIERYAEQIKSPLTRFEYDFGIFWNHNQVIYKSDDYSLALPKLSLPGEHQYINAATSIAAVKLLKGVTITDEMISYGLQHASWLGRLQKVNSGKIYNTLPKTWEIWLDGAHNPAGSNVVANWLKNQNALPIYMIIGITKGRDIKKLLQPYTGIITKLIPVSVKSEPLSHSGEIICEQALALGIDAIAKEDIEDAVLYLRNNIFEGKVRVIITGSLFLVADALSYN